MLIARQSVATRIPVRLVDGTGVPVTGKGSSDVLGAAALLVKGDGTTASITLVNGTNWFEISNSLAPGLYHLLLSSGVLGVLGPSQLSILPSASAFVGTIGTFLVESFPATVDAVNTKIGTPTGASVSADIGSAITAATAAQTAAVAASAAALVTRKIQTNRWKIFSNTLVVYDDDKTSVLYTFNLLDDTGAPSMTKIFERVPV